MESRINVSFVSTAKDPKSQQMETKITQGEKKNREVTSAIPNSYSPPPMTRRNTIEEEHNEIKTSEVKIQSNFSGDKKTPNSKTGISLPHTSADHCIVKSANQMPMGEHAQIDHSTGSDFKHEEIEEENIYEEIDFRKLAKELQETNRKWKAPEVIVKTENQAERVNQYGGAKDDKGVKDAVKRDISSHEEEEGQYESMAEINFVRDDCSSFDWRGETATCQHVSDARPEGMVRSKGVAMETSEKPRRASTSAHVSQISNSIEPQYAKVRSRWGKRSNSLDASMGSLQAHKLNRELMDTLKKHKILASKSEVKKSPPAPPKRDINTKRTYSPKRTTRSEMADQPNSSSLSGEGPPLGGIPEKPAIPLRKPIFLTNRKELIGNGKRHASDPGKRRATVGGLASQRSLSIPDGKHHRSHSLGDFTEPIYENMDTILRFSNELPGHKLDGYYELEDGGQGPKDAASKTPHNSESQETIPTKPKQVTMTIISAQDRASLKKCETLQEDPGFVIPRDLRGLRVSEVSKCLRQINAGEIADLFERNLIDGEMLVALDDDAMTDLGVDKFYRLKLQKFIAGWRPNL